MASSTKTIQKGFWVALTLAPGTAPSRCYVGLVDAVDDRGVRITLMDWIVGAACGYDLFVPWENIESVLVCTPDHDKDGFGDYASEWQTRMNKVQKEDANG